MIDKKYIPALILAGVIAVLLTVYISNSATRAIDYSSEFEKNLLIKLLDSQAREYKLIEESNQIEVPADFSYQASQIETLDMVNSQKGNELFDDGEMGVTESERSILKKRALEGELSKTISSLDSIDAARVHIAEVKTQIFNKSNNEQTKAVVTVYPEHKLRADIISRIKIIVSSAVPNLISENVKVISSKAGDSVYVGDDPIAKREAMIQRKVEKVLDVLTLEDYKVVVNVVADTDRKKETIELPVKTKQGLLEEETTSEDGRKKSLKKYALGKKSTTTESEFEVKSISIFVGLVTSADYKNEYIEGLIFNLLSENDIVKVVVHKEAPATGLVSKESEKISNDLEYFVYILIALISLLAGYLVSVLLGFRSQDAEFTKDELNVMKELLLNEDAKDGSNPFKEKIKSI